MNLKKINACIQPNESQTAFLPKKKIKKPYIYIIYMEKISILTHQFENVKIMFTFLVDA